MPSNQLEPTQNLRIAKFIHVFMLCSLVIYLGVAWYTGPLLQHKIMLDESQRVLLRTALYVISIVTLPLTNLIRHIQIRLNQTMPGPKSAVERYTLTVMVSLVSVEAIALYGLIMYWLGDPVNTLYILMGMSALGMYLYRPKQDELDLIQNALEYKQE